MISIIKFIGPPSYMEDKKVLGEFHAKISKAKILYDSTSAANQRLRREAAQLQKEYQNLKNNRIQTQSWEKDAHQRMQDMKNQNKQQSDRCYRQTKQLQDLRNTRKQLERERTICESELKRCNLHLQQLIKKREELQVNANNLTDKLNSSKAQKNVITEQLQKTNKAIEKYNNLIEKLEADIAEMRRVVTENTVPVHKVYDEDMRKSMEKTRRN